MGYTGFAHASTVVVAAVFAIGIWWNGDTLKADWLKFYSYAVLALSVALAVWDQWAWGWIQHPRFPRLKSVPRDLRGTWRGVLTSRWVDPNTGKSPAPKPAYLVIRQTRPTIDVVLLTVESKSRSTLASVYADDVEASLNYIYLNKPKAAVEHRSRMHYGAVNLEISGQPAKRLLGRYWTSRDSEGDLDFSERVPQTVDDYDQAVALFSE